MLFQSFADSVMLCEILADERDNALTGQKALKVELENLRLEKEQLICEPRELKENIFTDEFVALEREQESLKLKNQELENAMSELRRNSQDKERIKHGGNRA